MIRTVIFDIDGTLYDYSAANTAAMDALRAYCREHFGWDAETFKAEHKAAYDELNHQAAGTAVSHNRLIRYGLMMEKADLSMSHALAMNDLYWGTFLDHMEIFPGLKETLMDLKQAGYRLGIGSNMTADLQYRKLAKLGILELFSFIVTSEEALAEKPDPALFQRCIHKAGCEPQECLYIGDEPEKDAAGAEAAGMKALLYDPARSYQKMDKLRNDMIFVDYSELTTRIGTID
jgi:putative hydrolase of the HAD superfamily